MKYTCIRTSCCTVTVAVLGYSYDEVQSAAFAMYIQLSRVLKYDLCRSFVVELCFALRCMQYCHSLTTNILRLTDQWGNFHCDCTA